MLAFLKLIRLPNLFIIALTQYAMRWGIIYPILKWINAYLSQTAPQLAEQDLFKLQLSEWQFFLLSLSTVMIAAAGYIINDYFDEKIDRINKPVQLIIDKGIKRRVAMGAHMVINFLAITIGVSLAYSIGMWKLGLIYFVSASGLWYYSTTFKRQFLVGNILVAFLTGLVPLMVGLFEIPLLIRQYGTLIAQYNINFNIIFNFIAGFSFFAFITTLIREILKDVEDMEGDQAFGCNTLPIALGIGKTKKIIASLILICILVIAYDQYTLFRSHAFLSFGYLLVLIQIPFMLLLYKTMKAKESKEFTFPEKLSKLIMILGILYSCIIYVEF